MNCNRIVCVDEKPKEEGKLFFGEYGNLIRIDKIQFPQIRKLYESSESNTWFMNEIDYSNDIVGWDTLPPRAQRMFRLNIGYQTLMDSGVTNIFDDISRVASVSELQYLYKRISTEESIHSLTYSNGLNIVFGAQAEEILDTVYTDKIVQNRMKNEADGAEEFYELCIKQNRSDDEAKMALLKLLGASFALEGIKFPFSFFVTWSINKAYKNPIQGFSRALKLIGWDEMTVHTVTGSTVLNILRKDGSQGFSHLFEEFDRWFLGFVQDTVKQELRWNDYLLEEGSIPGYNKEIGEHFIKYWADRRLKEIKLQPFYNEKSSDIINWYNKYRDLNGTTTALQEADATNYQKGKLVNDLDKFENFEGFPDA
jgi:ribonucleoside-diphosphate reductase beta chain